MGDNILSLSTLLRSQVERHGAKVAFECEGRTTSFVELELRANRVANGLTAQGIERGDRVAYLGKNSDWFFEILLGCARAGIVLVPINWRLSPKEVEFILTDCEARILFVSQDFSATFGALGQECTDGFAHTVWLEALDERGFPSWRGRQRDDDPNLPVDANEAVLQLYTSGTTGRPKGAILSHANLLVLRSWHIGNPPVETLRDDDVMLIAMPLFHIAGTITGIWALQKGLRAVIMREFSARQMLEAIEHQGVTVCILVPAAMQMLASDPVAKSTDFSRLRYMFYGASPISVSLLRECLALFGCGLVQAYGMTETAGPIVVLTPEDHLAQDGALMLSAGRPVPGVEIRIVDRNRAALPVGDVGEIAIRSRSNMVGYWRRPEAYAESVDTEGWFYTGDAGTLDEQGYLYIRDRIKDMIISGGENVYPAEVENAISGHPDVADVAIIGVPDPKWGECVKAIVVAKPGACPSADAILAWARDHIAAYKVPKSVDFVSDLPRNAGGKILRRQLRDAYWAGSDRQIA